LVISTNSCLQCFDIVLVGRQEDYPACKNWVMRCWCGYLSLARCRLFAYGPADATASQNPIILVSFKSRRLTGLHTLSWKEEFNRRVCNFNFQLICASFQRCQWFWDSSVVLSTCLHCVWCVGILQHAHIITTCFAVVPRICHLFLISVSAHYLEICLLSYKPVAEGVPEVDRVRVDVS